MSGGCAVKQRIKRLIFFLAYYTGVDALFFWLNRRAKRIVVFHNVIADELAKGLPEGIVGLKFSEFKEIVRECARHFRFSTDVFDATTLTITFDDGYRNQYSTAFRYLRDQSIPAILFYSPGTQDVLTIDKMVFWRELVPREKVPGGNIGRFWCDEFWPRFLSDGATRGQTTLAWLEGLCPLEPLMAKLPQPFLRERLGSISDAELDEMRSAGWLIGWHTKTHTPLSSLTETELRDELDAPSAFRNVVMAYPYGTESAVGDKAIDVARAMGYPAALSYANHGARIGGRHFLPRLPSIGTDKYLLHAQLSGLSYFLSYRRLLPIIARTF